MIWHISKSEETYRSSQLTTKFSSNQQDQEEAWSAYVDDSIIDIILANEKHHVFSDKPMNFDHFEINTKER